MNFISQEELLMAYHFPPTVTRQIQEAQFPMRPCQLHAKNMGYAAFVFATKSISTACSEMWHQAVWTPPGLAQVVWTPGADWLTDTGSEDIWELTD